MPLRGADVVKKLTLGGGLKCFLGGDKRGKGLENGRLIPAGWVFIKGRGFVQKLGGAGGQKRPLFQGESTWWSGKSLMGGGS